MTHEIDYEDEEPSLPIRVVRASHRCRCGKIGFGSQRQATRGLRRWQRGSRKTSFNNAHAYPCEISPGVWHVGHHYHAMD